MSVLQFLRERAGILVAGLIGFSLLIFVVSDFFGRGRNQGRKMRKYYEIGQISGEPVSYQDFETRLQNLINIYKMSGRQSIDEATSENLREQVWQQMVREKILDSQYENLGIGVSTEEVDEMVLGNSPHPIVQQLFTDPQTGIFNKSFLVNFLKQTEVDASAKNYWLFFEDEIVNDRMNSKYNTLVSKGLYVTSKQAEFERQLNANSADFSYVMKNFASIADSSLNISKADLEPYYEKHKESYKRTAARDIEYVTFEVVPSEDDMKQAQEWISKTKAEFAAAKDPVEFINLTADTRHVGFYVPLSNVPENLRDFVKLENRDSIFGPYMEDGSYKLARLIDVQNRPDSVHARHILLSPSQTRTMEQARHQADSLVKLIKSGTSFETLAMANSDDEGSKQLGGDLGWFPEGRMVGPFNDACFTTEKGQITISETTFGIHIIQVLDRSKPVRKYNVGIIDRKIIPGSATNQRVYADASQFAGTNDTYDKFNKAVAEKGLNKRIATDVAPQQKTLPGLDNPRYLIMSLFNAKPGDIVLDNNQQAVFEIDNKYVVAYCTRAQEEGIAPLKDVENDVRYAVIKEKKSDIIAEEFRSKSGKSLDEISREMNLPVQEATGINFRSYSVQGAGTEPALIAAASAAPQGQTAGPVEGVNGVFMLNVNNITQTTQEDAKVMLDRLRSTFTMRGSYEAYEALRRDAKIVDKRYKFY
ncbi:MAG TPA: peptidylprolyl isomerase [Bacteroidales bacterium]|jgi:peptidyl-prolyl cis-trans isomerase D|nr:peptidylprolyl isomerase [Bacteroidales bacterium]